MRNPPGSISRSLSHTLANADAAQLAGPVNASHLPLLAHCRLAAQAALGMQLAHKNAQTKRRPFFHCCLCTLLLLGAPYFLLGEKRLAVSCAMAAEIMETQKKQPSEAFFPTNAAKRPANASSAGRQATEANASAHDLRISQQLTRELSRLLRPEQPTERAPVFFTFPALTPDPAPDSVPDAQQGASAAPKKIQSAHPEKAQPPQQAQNGTSSPQAGKLPTTLKTTTESALPAAAEALAKAQPAPAAKNAKAGVVAPAAEKTKAPVAAPAEDKSGENAETVARQNIIRAEIHAANLMVLSAPHEGVIAAVLVRDGDSVGKGQSMARFDAQAEEQALVLTQSYAADAFNRLGALPEGPSRERDGLAAEYLRHSAQVRSHENRLAQSAIKAPFAGTVTQVHVRAGEHVKQGDALVEITEKGSLEIVCAVPSVWIRWLKPGHIVWVYVDETAKSYEAELVRLGGKVDAGSKTLKVYARFAASPTDLLPGMSGSASIRPQLAQEYRKTKDAAETHSAPR